MIAEDCVRQMREEVFQETRLTVSAGIAPNKVGDFVSSSSCFDIELHILDACEGG